MVGLRAAPVYATAVVYCGKIPRAMKVLQQVSSLLDDSHTVQLDVTYRYRNTYRLGVSS